MTVTINGTGTIGGLVAGGLPDGTILKSEMGVNGTWAPVGTIVQVVYGYTTTSVASSSASFVDTGLTATITPTSAANKILILVNQNAIFREGVTAGSYTSLQLVRNGTGIGYFGYTVGYTSVAQILSGVAGNNYLDAPATTSALTYKTQFSCAGGSLTQVQRDSSCISGITLMEIAA